MKKHLLIGGMILLSSFCSLKAQNGSPVKISGEWYLANQSTFNDESFGNKFVIKRGYLTFKKEINDIFSVRYTQDVTLDKSGEDIGDLKLRLKYLFLKVKLDRIRFLRNSFLEVGVVHRPWLDFAQKIIPYRAQGKFFLERSGIVNSADFGVNMVTLFGGEIDESYQKRVSKHYPGKWGSWSVGVFHGSGYHEPERNNNKTIESRLTLRPFPELIPGLQFSHHFIYGKGNIEASPLFVHNLLHLAFESRPVTLTAEVFTGIGDYKGAYIAGDGTPYANKGYSFFAEVYIIPGRLSLFGRYDGFLLEDENAEMSNTLIGGICYRFLKNQMVFVDIDRWTRGNETITILDLSLAIRF